MKNDSTPELALLKQGAFFKVLRVNGKAGMTMPEHHSTQEAIIMVQQGSAVLMLENKEYLLQKDEPFIIPAGKVHSLYLKEDFQATVIMALHSEIKF
uniref:Cupin domain-containing protein n=1 Tax=Roseihalotalea indica TaxID=2867963 RepID=A0AA49JDI8_9BACT|nr:cupin domain-containing protein [Tunicatimonas sp. TK19036]